MLKELNYNQVLQDFTYKPNFAYTAIRRDNDVWWIKIVMMVENAREPMIPWDTKPENRYRPDTFYFGGMMDDFRYRSDFAHFSPSRTVIPVEGNYPIPFFEPGDETLFITWMINTLKSMEIHEADEWARYKGELVDDPHK